MKVEGDDIWAFLCGAKAVGLPINAITEALRPYLKPAPSESPPKRKRAPKGTFDKVAYQRDYMRKRRKAERERSTKK